MADTYDVLTLAEAKSILHIDTTDTAKDGALAQVVTALSRRLDNGIGPSVVRSVTNERHDGGRIKIELYYSPVTSVLSITEFQNTNARPLTEETPGTSPTDGWYGEPYRPDPRLYSGVVVRRNGQFDDRFWDGRGNVVCSYSAGRSVSTGAVDDRIKEGAAIFLKSWWRAYEQSVASMEEFDVPRQTFPHCAVPKATKEMLRDMWLPETGFGA